MSNNVFPKKAAESKFDQFKKKASNRSRYYQSHLYPTDGFFTLIKLSRSKLFNRMKYIYLFTLLLFAGSLIAQDDKKWQGKFEQLDQMLPTPNEFRAGSGAPGSKYWQQRADYNIEAELDEATNTLKGKRDDHVLQQFTGSIKISLVASWIRTSTKKKMKILVRFSAVSTIRSRPNKRNGSYVHWM